MHRYHTCPAIGAIAVAADETQRKWIEEGNTASIRILRSEAHQFPCLWARAIVPKALIPEEPGIKIGDNDTQYIGSSFGEIGERGAIGTDGSGGSSKVQAELRRVSRSSVRRIC